MQAITGAPQTCPQLKTSQNLQKEGNKSFTAIIQGYQYFVRMVSL
jgi:hypothetical protein